MAYSRIPGVFPVLHGEGLTLREMCEEDLPAWFARLSDPEAAAMAGDSLATSMQDVVDGLAYHRNAFATKEALRWAIVPDSLGASVGSIGIVRLDEENLSGEIGAAVGRAHWGQGFATGATRLVVDYGFGVLGLERIEAVALASNGRSVRVLEKLGFTREGLLRGYRIVNGTRADFAIYGLLGSDWSMRATDSR
ncbi:MAG: GNAT family N-acetyltransferase [Chloroflexi bacterium]|nr:GNAT family N-acetyltransferase [Chloroflexota bacterium]